MHQFFFSPVDLRKVTCSELYIYRPVLPPPLARKRQNISHGGFSNENVGN